MWQPRSSSLHWQNVAEKSVPCSSMMRSNAVSDVLVISGHTQDCQRRHTQTSSPQPKRLGMASPLAQPLSMTLLPAKLLPAIMVPHSVAIHLAVVLDTISCHDSQIGSCSRVLPSRRRLSVSSLSVFKSAGQTSLKRCVVEDLS